jgi:hypothetical protein
MTNGTTSGRAAARTALRLASPTQESA